MSHRGVGEVFEADAILARARPFRLSAEAIRDNALAISGLLSTATGGPPVFPPQPAGLWRQVAYPFRKPRDGRLAAEVVRDRDPARAPMTGVTRA